MINHFKFCPRCQKQLQPKGKNYVDCHACGFRFYFNPVPTVALILENENEEILLVKRKFAPKKGFWDLPGGFINWQETAEEAIKRELKEEINIKINNINLLGTYVGFYPYKGIKYQPLCLIFYGKIAKSKINNLKPADDVSSFQFFPKNKIPWSKLAFIDIKKGLRDYLS